MTDLNVRVRLQALVVDDQAKKIATLQGELVSVKEVLAGKDAQAQAEQDKLLSQFQDELAIEKIRTEAAEKESGRLAGLLRTSTELLTEVKATYERTAFQLSTLQSQYDEKSALAFEGARHKDTLDLANALIAELKAAKATAHKKMVAVQSELTEAKAEISRLRQGQSQSAQVAGEVARLQQELAKANEVISKLRQGQGAQTAGEVARLQQALDESNNKIIELEALLNKLATVSDEARSKLQSAANHSDKTNKMLAAAYEETQKLRRKLAYVSRVNQLMHRETVYSVQDKLDVFLLSTNANWLGVPYSQTEYCTYFMLDVHGRGQVLHEYNGALRVHSGDDIPLADSERELLLGEIMKITSKDYIAGMTKGHELANQVSCNALASKDATDDLQSVATHLRNTPEGDALLADFAVVQKLLLAHRREKAAKEKQQKRGR